MLYFVCAYPQNSQEDQYNDVLSIALKQTKAGLRSFLVLLLKQFHEHLQVLKVKVQVYSLIASLRTYHPTLHFTL